MKDIARMALKPGMEIGVDIKNYKGEVIVPARTIVDNNVINKLARHSIVCVTVMEEIDYATTHFEKVRLSKGFIDFSKVYNNAMPKYKEIMQKFVFEGVPFQMDELIHIYEDITSTLEKPSYLLDYLYNMLPTEDDLTYAHCLNSGLLAGLFASWFSLKKEETLLLVQCGLLYDIGKLKLPNELIWKPGKLSQLEFEKIKTHTFLGFQLLQNMPINAHVLNAALMHHEKFDGSGYPSKLHDVQIDLYARYIAIVDAYEAMTSPRTYRQSKNPFEVIAIFEKDAFKYDTDLLKPFLYRIANHLIGMNVMLSNDQVAAVIMVNPWHLGRPLVRVIDDGSFIDLAARRDISIRNMY